MSCANVTVMFPLLKRHSHLLLKRRGSPGWGPFVGHGDTALACSCPMLRADRIVTVNIAKSFSLAFVFGKQRCKNAEGKIKAV